MTEAQVWAAIALAAIAVSVVLVIFVARTSISNANALSILEKLDARVDDRVAGIVARYKEMLEKRKPQEIERPTRTEEEGDYVRVFDTLGSEEAIGDQPPPGEGLEIVENA